jgi:hypothetical protein
VPGTGLEPVCPFGVADFKSAASAISPPRPCRRVYGTGPALLERFRSPAGAGTGGTLRADRMPMRGRLPLVGRNDALADVDCLLYAARHHWTARGVECRVRSPVALRGPVRYRRHRRSDPRSRILATALGGHAAADSQARKRPPSRSARPPRSSKVVVEGGRIRSPVCWRRRADSNRRSRFCRPLPCHLATSPGGEG